MSAVNSPLAEIDQEARAILVRELGVVDAHRFLSQFRRSSGDYTKERGKWLDDLSLDQIVSEIKAKRRKTRKRKG
jgi:hypothetical protein